MMSFIWFVISKKRFVRLVSLTFPTTVDLRSCSKIRKSPLPTKDFTKNLAILTNGEA